MSWAMKIVKWVCEEKPSIVVLAVEIKCKAFLFLSRSTTTDFSEDGATVISSIKLT